MADKDRHAHFVDPVDVEYDDRSEKSEKLHEEELMEFKQKQRRRSSVAKLPKSASSLASLISSTRRTSVASGESSCKYTDTERELIEFIPFTMDLSFGHLY